MCWRLTPQMYHQSSRRGWVLGMVINILISLVWSLQLGGRYHTRVWLVGFEDVRPIQFHPHHVKGILLILKEKKRSGFFYITTGIWSEWMSWGPCTKTCQGGLMVRRRTCIGGGRCEGLASDERKCNEQRCRREYPSQFTVITSDLIMPRLNSPFSNITSVKKGRFSGRKRRRIMA